jgi:hypothetical protein
MLVGAARAGMMSGRAGFPIAFAPLPRLAFRRAAGKGRSPNKKFENNPMHSSRPVTEQGLARSTTTFALSGKTGA